MVGYRDISVQEFLQLGGRLTHINLNDKQRRTVTIAFWPDEDKANLYYAAAVWKPDTATDVFNKEARQQCNSTAVARFFKNPVQRADPYVWEDETDQHINDRRRFYILNQIRERWEVKSFVDNTDIDLYQLMLEVHDKR